MHPKIFRRSDSSSKFLEPPSPKASKYLGGNREAKSIPLRFLGNSKEYPRTIQGTFKEDPRGIEGTSEECLRKPKENPRETQGKPKEIHWSFQ